MNKKKIWIPVAIAAVFVIGLIVYGLIIPGEYTPKDDEIALHIKLDIEEDIGLLVYDYRADGRAYSGGTSCADKSLIRRDSDNIVVWNRQELNSSSDAVALSVQFRIITEYVEPNYENVYPESITKYVTPISFEARFGESCYVTITGSREKGYTAVPGRQDGSYPG